ncbi:MAG: polysaccharide biosynthesis protein [Hyphomonadaceae bacterium]|nr:polysaccharide biosynthesis protein [Clostridia bacterium]
MAILILGLDIILINVAMFFALWLRFDMKPTTDFYLFLNVYMQSMWWITAVKITTFYFFRLYSTLWHYAQLEEVFSVAVATGVNIILIILLSFQLDCLLPRSCYVTAWVFTFLLMVFSRLSYRALRRLNRTRYVKMNHRDLKNTMVVGAGQMGAWIIQEMKKNPHSTMRPVVLVDDDEGKYRSRINGVPVLGNRSSIKHLVERFDIHEIVVAMPSATNEQLTQILNICSETKCKLKTLPSLRELLANGFSLGQVRDVRIEDLLGRDTIQLTDECAFDYISGQVVLVTGGGGSIGSELCRQIAKMKPKKILVFEIYENSAYEIQNELQYTYGDALDMQVFIGSIRDRKRLEHIFELHKPTVLFHAAAHKHVPLMESDPKEAIKNNIMGTLNTAQTAIKYGIKRFVLISTDKAVNPTNVMGATKRVAEMLVQSLNGDGTIFTAVRFGNVLGSNGSVVPLFQKQIAQGGPITVTHPDITRFFMTIPEAAQLVIQAGAIANGGEIFVLDMGDPVKIVDLAKDIIRLSGLEPEIDIAIKFTGLRPGEKLYEELMMDEEGLIETNLKKIFIGKQVVQDKDELLAQLSDIGKVLEADDISAKRWLKKVVNTYQLKE